MRAPVATPTELGSPTPLASGSPAGTNYGLSRPLPVIPDHELLHPIGRGAYGEVWLARSVVAWTNFLYRNNRDGTFTQKFPSEVGPISGDYGVWGGGYWGDYDNDGDLDVAASGSPGGFVFRNNGTGDFEEALDWFEAGNGSPTWADYDNDGHLDLLVIRGQDSESQLRLFHNNGDGTFTQVEDALTQPIANWMGGGLRPEAYLGRSKPRMPAARLCPEPPTPLSGQFVTACPPTNGRPTLTPNALATSAGFHSSKDLLLPFHRPLEFYPMI